MVMPRTQTLVQLSDALVAALDQRAAKHGVSRSQLIREAVEAHLRDDLDAEISRRIVAGYERFPQASTDDWGDPEAWTVGSAKQAHSRLDTEERDSGHPPW